MNDEVYMDIPAVTQIAETFGKIAETLETVVKVLEALITTLNATAFIGLVGGRAIAQFMEMIKPYVEEMGKKCEELDKDVRASIRAYQNGDAEGATRFH
jgi:hypothetical protein